MDTYPTHLNPQWIILKAKDPIALEAISILQADLLNRNSSNDSPFVVLADGEFMTTPKYLWRTGKKAQQHMQSHRVRDIGTASLKDWLDNILSSDEPLGSDEEETEAVPEETEATAEQGDIEKDTDQVEAYIEVDTQQVEDLCVCATPASET